MFVEALARGVALLARGAVEGGAAHSTPMGGKLAVRSAGSIGEVSVNNLSQYI